MPVQQTIRILRQALLVVGLLVLLGGLDSNGDMATWRAA